jgi:hypothetical protein
MIVLGILYLVAFVVLFGASEWFRWWTYVAWAIGVPIIAVLWYWLHTWPLHAWREEGFWRWWWRRFSRSDR